MAESRPEEAVITSRCNFRVMTTGQGFVFGSDYRTRMVRGPRAGPAVVAARGSPSERRTESLLGNSRAEGHLLGPSVREQTPNRTPFCSAPLLVCLVCRFLHCQELACVTALIVMIKVCLTLLVLGGPHFFLERPELRRYDRK